MKKTIAVLGLGLFGSALAKSLARQGVDVIAIDVLMDHVEEVMEDVALAAQADFTKLDQLEDLGINDVDMAIIASGQKLETAILGIINLNKLGITNVIVKTKSAEYKEVLLKIGASRVILPEKEMGNLLGIELANPNLLDVFKLDNYNNILELRVEKEWIGKSIIDLDIRNKFGYNIIAIKECNSDNYNLQLDPKYKFKEGDIILIFTNNN